MTNSRVKGFLADGCKRERYAMPPVRPMLYRLRDDELLRGSRAVGIRRAITWALA